MPPPIGVSAPAAAPQDYDLKFGLLEDVYTINDVEGKLGHGVDGKPLETTVGGFDLIYQGGPVRTDRHETHMSKLGCFEPQERLRSLKKLFAKHGIEHKVPASQSL